MASPSDGAKDAESARPIDVPNEPENTDAPDLPAVLAILTHNALIDHDTIAGLNARLVTLAARIEVLETTDVGVAYARIDFLEDQREVKQHELGLEIRHHREALAEVRDDLAMAVAGVDLVKKSTTWKVGSAVVRPLAKLAGRLKK